MTLQWVKPVLTRNREMLTKLVGQKWMPVRALGSGSYGTVYSTSDPGVVMKITSDASEANLVAFTVDLVNREHRSMPEGLVRYFRIVQLPRAEHPNDWSVYVIWREAAHHVGFLEKDDTRAAVLLGLPSSYSIWAVRDALWDYRTAASRAYSAYLKKKELKIKEADAISASIQRISSISALSTLGETLMFYYKHGAVISDVSLTNLGFVVRNSRKTLVITDPSHTAFLRSKRYKKPARLTAALLR